MFKRNLMSVLIVFFIVIVALIWAGFMVWAVPLSSPGLEHVFAFSPSVFLIWAAWAAWGELQQRTPSPWGRNWD